MTPEDLAQRFTDQFKDIGAYIDNHGSEFRDGVIKYSRELSEWIALEFGELPADVVDGAREILKCSVADMFRYRLTGWHR